MFLNPLGTRKSLWVLFNPGRAIVSIHNQDFVKLNIFLRVLYTALLSKNVVTAKLDMWSESTLQSVADIVKASPLGQW